MNRIPCFLYKDGEHFRLPPELRTAPANVAVFADLDGKGGLIPNSRLFRPVSSADDAAVFLFPYDIGMFVDGEKTDAIAGVIAGLPYFSGRERRHIVCDDGDVVNGITLKVCLIKMSVTSETEPDCIASAYRLPPHILADKPVFNWNVIRYDTSFVGNITNIARKAVVAAVRQQAPDLRVFVDFDDAFTIQGQHYYLADKGPAHLAERQTLYRQSLKQSLTVLCPPGVGPQSIRMYETMYMGRIPVIFEDNIVYPLNRVVDYEAFCLRVPGAEIMNTGNILRDWLRARSPEELRERCVLACKTWNRYFSSEKLLPALLEEARLKFWS